MAPARACAAVTPATPATMASVAALTAPNASERLNPRFRFHPIASAKRERPGRGQPSRPIRTR